MGDITSVLMMHDESVLEKWHQISENNISVRGASG